jgi:hypothetical protein
MKYRTMLFGLLLLLTTATRASAQFMPYDSVELESPLLFSFEVVDTSSMFGGPDGNCAQFNAGGTCSLRFMAGSNAITMQKGQPIHIYWKIPSLAPGDSNVARIHLQNLGSDLMLHYETIFYVWEPSTLNTEAMSTIIVPDTGFNAVGIEVAADTGGNSFWLDAMVLVQSGTAAVGQAVHSQQPVLMNYPNPFYHASGTRVQINPPVAGNGMLSVTDALGREVARVPLGELNAGDQEASLMLDRAGVFFVRLFVDGSPVGAPLEISGE